MHSVADSVRGEDYYQTLTIYIYIYLNAQNCDDEKKI